MNALRAWGIVMLFGGLGIAVLMDVRIPKDPDCIGRCRLDSLARMQREFGSAELGGFMILMGLAGFVWYSKRD
jgi:hypothetical protein